MVRITSMKIKNFGPYIDETLEFPDDDGICYIWGENGSGKTTLLNIFKYAFFGTLFDGKYKEYSKAKTMNYNTKGRFFGVTLKFHSNGDKYELSRFQHVRDGVEKPVINTDFKEELILIKNGISLSKDDITKTLNQLMPEDISQFFFFDSERLSVFEKLMDEEDSDGLGKKVKDSIEKILGIPVLKNCMMILKEIISDYDKKIAKAGRDDENLKSMSEAYAKICDKLKSLDNDFEKRMDEKSDLEAQKADLEDKLRSSMKNIKILESKKATENQLKSEQNNLLQLKERMKKQMGSVWVSMLASTIEEAESKIMPRYSELERNIGIHDLLVNQKAENRCPICGRPYDASHPCPSTIDVTDKDKEEFRRLSELKSLFDSHKNGSDARMAILLEKEIMETNNKVYSLKRQIEDYRTQIELTSDEEKDYESLQRNYVNVEKKIEEVSRAIKDINQNIEKERSLKEKVIRNMEGLSSGETSKLFDRQTFYKKVATVLEMSIDTYCESMRKHVERDASEFFLKVDNSGFYSGLKINDNYGLSLIDAEGHEVPAPSTGYQHMMALSLIRGIHKNAPIEGPAIVDYLFGHIDNTHKPLVAKASPDLSEQVIVLAFEDEFDQQELRKILSKDLLREFKLIREESYSTRIQIN